MDEMNELIPQTIVDRWNKQVAACGESGHSFSRACHPEEIMSLLRVDTYMNDGEGLIERIKVQMKMRDRTGVKPYLVLDVEVSPLTGFMRFDVREDRSFRLRCSFWRNIDLEGMESDRVFGRLLVMCAALMMGLDDYPLEVAALAQFTAYDWQPHTWPGLNRLFPTLRDLWNGSPVVSESPFKDASALVPGQWYCVAQQVPAGFISLEIGKYVSEQREWNITSDSFLASCDQNLGLLKLKMRRDRIELPSLKKEGRCVLWLGRPQFDHSKIFALPEEFVRDLTRFLSKEFDWSVELRPEMPVWDRPLDTVENCVERIKTKRFGYDPKQYREALTWLVRHRDQLTERINIHTTSRWEGASDAQIAEWKEIHEGSLETCGCGACRAIIPSSWRTEFAASPDGPTVLRRGRRYVVRRPDGSDVRYRFWVDDGSMFMVCKPGSDEARHPSEASLYRLASIVREAGEKGYEFRTTTRPICRVDAVDAKAMTVTVTPDEAYVIVEVTETEKAG